MIYDITVIDWDSYVESRSHHYFRMYNNFFDDHRIRKLRFSSKLVFIFCLSLASKKRSKNILFDMRLCKQDLNLRQFAVISALQDLENMGLIFLKLITADLMKSTSLKQKDPKKIRQKTVPKPSEPNLVYSAFVVYSEAYEKRYHVAPIKSPRSMGQLKQLLTRVDKSEVEKLIQFYLSHNDSFYTKKCHPIGLLLADCEKLRTEMLSGKIVKPANSYKSQSELASEWADEMRRNLREREV